VWSAFQDSAELSKALVVSKTLARLVVTEQVSFPLCCKANPCFNVSQN
jgi:hypothetical protein